MKNLLKLSLLFYSVLLFGQSPNESSYRSGESNNITTNTSGKQMVKLLIRRWKKSKEYTLAVFDAMPTDQLEYRPLANQMSFAQHFIHIGYINNSFIGVLIDAKTYPDFEALRGASFFIKRPDPVHLFEPDSLKKRTPAINQKLVRDYVVKTYDFVITSLENLNDQDLIIGEEKEKPWYLGGHTNLDLILRGESHTAHHRAQAILYLKMKGIIAPEYSKHNTL